MIKDKQLQSTAEWFSNRDLGVRNNKPILCDSLETDSSFSPCEETSFLAQKKR